MIRLAFAACLLCSTSAFAMDAPGPGRFDAHMRTAAYNPGNMESLEVPVGRSVLITLDVKERIARFILGDLTDNQPFKAPSKDQLQGGAPLLNNLPLWAVKPGTTNLTIISLTPDGAERPYTLWLKAVPAPKDGEDDANATYSLTYTYTPQQQQTAEQQHIVAVSYKQRKEQEEQAKAEARMAVDPLYGQRNFKYLAIGDSSIAPYEASDNFRLTALRYPGNTDVPSIFLVDGPPWCDLSHAPPSSWLKAPERVTRVTQQDDMLVVTGTAMHYRLRLGQKVADISNCGYDPVGSNPGTGTSSPDVVRVIRQAAAQ